jgi:hypothetical protein
MSGHGARSNDQRKLRKMGWLRAFMRPTAPWRRPAPDARPAPPPAATRPDGGLRAPASGDGFGRGSGVTARRWRRARDHYHAVLVEHLRLHGARTTDELIGHIGWFRLPFTAREVDWLVDSARRHRLVEPLGSNAEARDEWIPTEQGLALRSPRGQRIADIHGDVRQGLAGIDGAAAAVAKLGSLVALVLTLGGFAAVQSDLKVKGWLAACLVAAVLLAVAAAIFAIGARGARMLRDAVLCWPRLAPERPACRRWIVTCAWREWAFPLGAWVVLLLGAAAFLTHHYVAAWAGAVLYALAAYLALGLVLFYRCWLRAHGVAFRAELEEAKSRWRARAHEPRVRT